MSRRLIRYVLDLITRFTHARSAANVKDNQTRDLTDAAEKFSHRVNGD